MDEIKCDYGEIKESKAINRFKKIGFLSLMAGSLLFTGRSGELVLSFFSSYKVEFILDVLSVVLFGGVLMFFYSVIIYDPFRRIGFLCVSRDNIVIYKGNMIERTIKLGSDINIDIERERKLSVFRSDNLFSLSITNSKFSETFVCQTSSWNNVDCIEKIIKR